MIVVTLNGRMGNQLFQHAFAYALMRRTKRVVHLFPVDHEEFIDRYFDTSLAVGGLTGALARFLQKMPNRLRKMIYRRARLSRVIVFDNKKSPIENMQKALDVLPSSCCIEGFFQAVPYFNEVASDVRAIFRVRSQFLREFDDVYGAHFKEGFVVAVHVRRGDYLSWDGVSYALPEAYFREAIERARSMAPQGKKMKILMLSDDLPWVRRHFTGAEYLTCEGDSSIEIIDLLAMMKADVVITSNSSFSWWGAFLNEKNAPVIGPEKWLGFQSGVEYPVGIFPEGWYRLALS